MFGVQGPGPRACLIRQSDTRVIAVVFTIDEVQPYTPRKADSNDFHWEISADGGVPEQFHAHMGVTCRGGVWVRKRGRGLFVHHRGHV
uniref:Uncharacterized protein n=1 Tax=Knipowitschia caucasica TaxID=637954 RepID=A0AAV2MDU1_KNICA